MKKVAIIKCEIFYDDGWISDCIARHITKWEEVDDEQFEMLKNSLSGYNRSGTYRFLLIEFPHKQREIMEESVKSYLEKVKKENYEKKRMRDIQDKKKDEMKQKRELRQLERLQSKYKAEK